MSLEHVQLFEEFVQTLKDQEAISENENVNEMHLEDRKDQEAYIIKNSDKTADDLKDLSDEEVKKLYASLEESKKVNEKKKVNEEDDEEEEDEDEEEDEEDEEETDESKKQVDESKKKVNEEDDEEADPNEEEGDDDEDDKMAKVRAAKKD